LSKEQTNDRIKDYLLSERPFLVCRFGSGELELMCLDKFLESKENIFFKVIKFIKGQLPIFWWDREQVRNKFFNSGLFPLERKTLTFFRKEMESCLPLIDVLGSWLSAEKYFIKSSFNVRFSKLPDLEPYFHEFPWSEQLEGKRVLVIHPFSKTIQSQYTRREKIFNNHRVLPEFELICYKSIQTIGFETHGYENWISALEKMKKDISKIDFEIAIIGCGSYGLPLAAFVKMIGKSAIHLGGATQILFGIKGSRWDKMPNISCLYNEYWVRPSEEEKPIGYEKVENGTYW
jgi:hypothetical protein